MARRNRQFIVKHWPEGLPREADFAMEDGPLPRCGDGQILVGNLYLSIDPYDRHALGPRFPGTPFRCLGDVMMTVTPERVFAGVPMPRACFT